MRKKIFYLILSILILSADVILTIFCFPNEIPFILSFDEKIVSLMCKWFIMFLAILPLIVTIIRIFSKNERFNEFLKLLFIIFIYQNIMIFMVFSLKNKFDIGKTFDISLSSIILLPLSIIFIFIANKIKNVKFKSRFGFYNKFSIETEFLWTQSQIIASENMKIMGLLLFVFSIISSFFHYFYFAFVLCILIVVVFVCITNKKIKNIYLKYSKMKDRNDKVNKK